MSAPIEFGCLRIETLDSDNNQASSNKSRQCLVSNLSRRASDHNNLQLVNPRATAMHVPPRRRQSRERIRSKSQGSMTALVTKGSERFAVAAILRGFLVGRGAQAVECGDRIAEVLQDLVRVHHIE